MSETSYTRVLLGGNHHIELKRIISKGFIMYYEYGSLICLGIEDCIERAPRRRGTQNRLVS